MSACQQEERNNVLEILQWGQEWWTSTTSVLRKYLKTNYHLDIQGICLESHVTHLWHRKIFDLTMNIRITKAPQYNIGFTILVCG